MDNQDKNIQLFMYLVSSFELGAMQAMGKLKNPLTDKIEVSLDQAQFSIDVLDMLKEKTKGNIGDYESRFLDNMLGQLKLNFIDVKEKENKPKEPGK
jgi:uncharacterized protein DUF1844